MSPSDESTTSTPQKRSLDIDHYQEDSRPSKTKKKTKVYTRPTDRQIADIIARVEHGEYTGLNPMVLLDKPHPIVGTVSQDGYTQVIPVLNDEILECGQTKNLDPEVHATYADRNDVVTRTSLLFIAIHHCVPEAMIGKHIIPADVKSGGSIDQDLREKISRQVQTVQNTTGKFFLKLVKDVREHFPGDDFDFAPDAKREPIWDHVWDQAPYRTAAAMLGQCASMIDLQNIFCNTTQDEVRKKWQSMFKAEFVKGCNAMCVHCPGPGDANFRGSLSKWHHEWRGLTDTVEWKAQYELWTVQKLPVPTLAFARRRREQPTQTRSLGSALVSFVDED